MNVNELLEKIEPFVEKHCQRIFLISACLFTLLGVGYVLHSLNTTGQTSIRLAGFHFFLAFIAWCLYALEGLISVGQALIYCLSDRVFKHVFLWIALSMALLGISFFCIGVLFQTKIV